MGKKKISEFTTVTPDASDKFLVEQTDGSYKSVLASAITTGATPDGLRSGGAITVGTYGGSGTNNDIRVAPAVWYISPDKYSTAINTDFLDIALSSSGLQRYIGLYGTTSNTITKVEGSEAALATYPTTPANSIVIGYVLVNDASASSTPDLSGYLLKLDKATQSTNTTGTNDTTYVTPLANAIKLNKNTAITGATKTKVTYDANGLVTSGADATTADIADSLNKRYVTDANLTVIGNTSGTNSGDNATNSQYSGLAASKEDISNKSSSYTASSTTTYANTKALVDGLGTKMYQISLMCAATSMADGLTYYMGFPYSGVLSGTASRYYPICKSGTIKEFSISVFIGGSLGSNEGTSFYFETYNRSNRTLIASTLITSAFDFSLSSGWIFNTYSGFSITLAGDEICQIKIVCPTWATNPTATQLLVLANVY